MPKIPTAKLAEHVENQSEQHDMQENNDRDAPKETEYICQESNRLTILPIVDHEIWTLAKLHESTHWVATEIKFEPKDRRDWQSLNNDERHFLEHILAFFASSDVLVNQNLAMRFMQEIRLLECQVFYGVQFAAENVHSETYALLIDYYIQDKQKKEYLFRAIENIPEVQKLAAWCRKWMLSDRPLGERLFAFALFEGCVFSGAFCAIYWIKSRGLLPALSLANDFIARDEGIHTDFAVTLINKLANRPSQEAIQQIVQEIVQIEYEFICCALPVSLIGMNCATMYEYIQYVADRIVQQCRFQRVYPAATMPFPFMDNISLVPKGNFFEKNISEYSVNTATTDVDDDPYAAC